jgi:putative copper resistance protein D
MMFAALLIVARSLQIAASILLAGIFTFEVVALGPTRSSASEDLHGVERRLLRVALWSLVAAVFSALLWFWLEAASMSGLSFGTAFSGTAWQTVLFETGFGRIWQLRLGLIAVATTLTALRLRRADLQSALKLVLWLVGIVLLVSLAWISHAAAARTQPLGLLGDALHLSAAGGWIGGLLPLTIFLAAAKDRLSLGAHAAHVLRRFSVLSLCCVSVLVISGLSNGWLLVGSVHALFTTQYGVLLLLKLILFSLLICSGARNRFVIKTKLLAASTPSDLLSQLRRNVIYELCLGTAVVAIVGWLGVTPPVHLASAPARTPTSASNLVLTLVRLLPDQRRDRERTGRECNES